MNAGLNSFSMFSGVFLALCFFGPICSESLPPFEDPSAVFKGTIEGVYVLVVGDNSVKIYLRATNQYDETLEGVAAIEGEMEISLVRDPSIRKTFVLTDANLITNRRYDPQTRILQVDPGETMVFGVSWNLVDENNQDLRSSVFQYWEDPDCEFRCVAEEELFVVRGSVQIFPKTGIVEAGLTSFQICHVSQWVNPKFCPPIDSSIPCSKKATKIMRCGSP